MTESSPTVSSESPRRARSSPRVFISYAHDSEAHCEQVRALWIFLRDNGVDARSDFPAAESRQDWTRWMEEQVAGADRILVVASPGYRKCLQSEVGQGERRGVRYEADAIRRRYDDTDPHHLGRVLPVVLPGGRDCDVPAFLRPDHTTVYKISAFTVEGAEKLLRVLHGRPREVEPEIGDVPDLPTRDHIPASGQRRPVRARTLTIGAIVAVITLTAVVVGFSVSPGSSSPLAGPAVVENLTAPPSVPPSDVPSLPVFVPQTQVKIDSPTFDAMKRRNRIRIATKTMNPGIVDRKPSADSAGFDAGMQELVAAGLGFSAAQIDRVTADAGDLSDLIRDGRADLVISAYTRTDHRHAAVSFAGPYFWAGQSLLVHHDEEQIAGPDDLQGRSVCTVTASTGANKIEKIDSAIKNRKKGEPIKIEQRANIDGCVNLLLGGSVDAVSTDDAILVGYQRSHPDQLKIVGEQFSGEPWGIAVPKGDKELCRKINEILGSAMRESDGDWQRIFDATLGRAGVPADMPAPSDEYCT